MMSLPAWSHVPSGGMVPEGGWSVGGGGWYQRGVEGIRSQREYSILYPSPILTTNGSTEVSDTHSTGMHSCFPS